MTQNWGKLMQLVSGKLVQQQTVTVASIAPLIELIAKLHIPPQLWDHPQRSLPPGEPFANERSSVPRLLLTLTRIDKDFISLVLSQ